MTGRLARETDEGKKIAVVLDNTGLHHAKGPERSLCPGQALERIMPIHTLRCLVFLGQWWKEYCFER